MNTAPTIAPGTAATLVHPSVELAASLDARQITELAETYREWRDVLAAAVDALHERGGPTSPALAAHLHDVLSANGQPVPPSDLEDASMALWLHAAATDAAHPDATTSLLSEPWRTFERRRTGGRVTLTV